MDACTHIVDQIYHDEEFKRLTLAERQKLWQLRNPEQTPGTGSTPRRTTTPTSSISAASAGTKRGRERTMSRDSDGDSSLFGTDTKDHSNKSNSALKRPAPTARQGLGKSEN